MHTEKKIHRKSYESCLGAGHCPVKHTTQENSMGAGKSFFRNAASELSRSRALPGKAYYAEKVLLSNAHPEKNCLDNPSLLRYNNDNHAVNPVHYGASLV